MVVRFGLVARGRGCRLRRSMVVQEELRRVRVGRECARWAGVIVRMEKADEVR